MSRHAAIMFISMTEAFMSVDISASPEVTKAPKASRSTKLVPTSTIHVRFAKLSGKNTTDAAKANRNYMRSNFEPIAKRWPELRKSHKANRDGNRWPTMIPSSLADDIVKRAVTKSK